MNRKLICLLCCAVLCVGGCQSSSFSEKENYDMTSPNYPQLQEIPVPEKAVMDMKNTLLFGGDPVVGRLSFTAPYAQLGLFDFYSQEAPKTGWSEVTSIRSENSVLTFMKDNRAMMVRLVPESETTSQIFIDISLTKGHKSN